MGRGRAGRRTSFGALLLLGCAAMALSAAAAPAGAAVSSSAPRALAHAAGPTKVCTIADTRLTEISGLAASVQHPGILWTHNDSGGGPTLYAIDATTCAVKAVITIADVPARDLEAIAIGRDGKGRPVIWVGDIGDNQDSWPFVRLHAVREPAVLTDQTLPARTWRFAYDDGKHDAETLLADPARPRLWVVTKAFLGAGVYALPPLPSLPSGGVQTTPLEATRVGGITGVITDGTVSPDGEQVVLRGYTSARLYNQLPPRKPAKAIVVPSQPQGEAIAWSTDGTSLYVASEGDPALWQVPVPGKASPSPSPSASRSPTASPSPSSTAPAEPAVVRGLSTRMRWVLGGALALGAIALVALASWRFRVD